MPGIRGDLDAFLDGYWNSPKVVFQSGGDRNVGFAAMKDRYFKRYKSAACVVPGSGFFGFSDDRRNPKPSLVPGPTS